MHTAAANLVSALSNARAAPLRMVEVLSGTERREVPAGWNGTAAVVPAAHVPELFEAGGGPGSGGDGGGLRVQHGELRAAERAGEPVDPGYPGQRIAFMLADAKPASGMKECLSPVSSGVRTLIPGERRPAAELGKAASGNLHGNERVSALSPGHPAVIKR